MKLNINAKSLVALFLIINTTTSATLMFPIIYAQAQEQQTIKGEVMNSKYLQVLEHKYCFACKSVELQGEVIGMRDTITGTIKNVHSEEVSLDGIFAIFYGKDGKIIDIEEGTLYPSYAIVPAEESTYEIEGLYEDATVRADFVRYVVVPLGAPY